ncbi:MFS transporter [Streptomyces sp. NBC_00654]|uniref:CynX/NimT family MFS transporter n=1 Tax=Streptomyces sp. NBC_00654 TaxID=2975799 RepID=UPI002254F025|nr:MFS transporter [Streptomyces sp. NBC_00654]MCX4966920.1 MFS transporter [Streptomyces sp. NBC_00654]
MDESDGHQGGAPRVGLLLVGILLIAANLRAPLTGVGSVLPMIEHDTGLSSTAAGLLNALPLLAFAATSPLVGRSAQRHGTERVLWIALLVLTAGIVLRSLPGVVTLFAGTVIMAAAIAYGNVLLPSLVKSTVPERRIAAVTGLYVTVMGLIAAVSSGVSVPLADHLPGGWHTALGCWAVLALLGVLAWAPQLARRRPVTSTAPGAEQGHTLWRYPLAWQVSAFMGLQSLGFYTTIAWLPSIVHDHGASEGAAGWQLFLLQVTGLASSSTVPILARQLTDQRLLAVSGSLMCATGYLGLLLAPEMATAWSVLIGLGGGACLVLALTFQGQRAADASQAAALSGMAQSVGYLLAAVGPLLFGSVHDLAGGWTVPLGLLVALTLVQGLFGLGAGRAVRLPQSTSAQLAPERKQSA